MKQFMNVGIARNLLESNLVSMKMVRFKFNFRNGWLG
ncbi:hypothetical protein AAULR_25456 [Lacticaseibacillus rhamnosus MTCC 5462]|nr:hypothetical protein AAULR_25456 [Lacticaseibacillus rhamnosus MTCC 5462]